mgnify:CR=1 FL=1
MKGIVDIQLKNLKKLLMEKNIDVVLTDAAKERLAEAGYDPVYGARSLKRLLQKEVYDVLAFKFLEGELGEDERIVVDAEKGQLVFKKDTGGANG